MENLSNVRALSTLIAWLAIATIILLNLVQKFTRSAKLESSTIPLLNRPNWYDIGGIRARLAFVLNARELLLRGAESGRPFRLLTDMGELIVLPAEYGKEIRNDTRLSFGEVIEQNFHAQLPGFEGFRQGTADARLTRDIANKQLTHSLASVTQALSEEAETALQALFPDSKEWSDVLLREKVLQLVARLSSRVFLGDEGARSQSWLQITTEYTKTAYIAAYILRLWPPVLRPLVHWVLPPCRKLRGQVAQARRIIVKIIEQRRKIGEISKAAREPIAQYNDTIAWFEQDSLEKDSQYDPVVAQLIFAQAAIETTADLLTQVILDIAKNPDLFEQLRSEVNREIDKGGWTKSSLHNMKLLDSVLKESQRLKPLAMTSMHRLVLEDVVLSDGLVLPKGGVIAVSGDRMWSTAVYEDPDCFQGDRFYKTRMEGGTLGNQAYFVSTGIDHLAFGYGKHACAGRFFVAHEVKIAMSHMLLNYDWRIASHSSSDANPVQFGLTMMANSKAQISIRSRAHKGG
ncbi:hypothetical protein PFICI_10194 [Pestalotiopsis fici W106-1]|uniref:Uncharacterized protein n=1 Tax=Pestalotiopsis fici (strain W106-1 / CGMCC3.15140) TaxID=1229662 RepID=W3WYC0_PESFW|nr:uncharacterized protein PFICI_10194 [Pestalotiopsis fici W106-1]ETS78132.1 hypothetical protein PFICI_10194 [Pestalotiopsis fici W106-1]